MRRFTDTINTRAQGPIHTLLMSVYCLTTCVCELSFQYQYCKPCNRSRPALNQKSVPWLARLSVTQQRPTENVKTRELSSFSLILPVLNSKSSDKPHYSGVEHTHSIHGSIWYSDSVKFDNNAEAIILIILWVHEWYFAKILVQYSRLT